MSFSDHEMVYCVRKLNWQKARPETKTFRNYSKYDPAKFCEELKGVDWSVSDPPSGSLDANLLCNCFKSKFEMIAERHTPTIQKRIHGIDNRQWITTDVKHDIRQHQYYLKKARRSNNSEDWANSRCLRN